MTDSKRMDDAIRNLPSFLGIPVFYAKKKVVEDLQKIQIDSLIEQVEKLKQRRDNWRKRYEEVKKLYTGQRKPSALWESWVACMALGYMVVDIIRAFIP